MPSTPVHGQPSFEPLPLGLIEELFWAVEEERGKFRPTTDVGVPLHPLVVLVRVDGCIESDTLASALGRLQQRHPKLRAVVVRRPDGRLRYEFDRHVPPIPFQMRDFDAEQSAWREETRRLLQMPFPASGPLAAVGVLRNRARSCSDLLLAVHHAIADGLSAIVLVEDLLTEYANVEANTGAAPPQVLPAATATRALQPPGWRNRLWLLRTLIRNQREERRARHSLLPEARDVPPQSQWVHWLFSREDTVRLVRRCRRERTSLGGVLVAAACCALMDCLPAATAVFKCQMPLNVRDTLEGQNGSITGEDIGCFISIINRFYQVGRQPSFWDLARRAHEDVETFIRRGGPSFYYNLMRAISNRAFSAAANRVAAPSVRRLTLLVTHYGVPRMRDAYGSLRPTACTLAFKHDGAGPSLVMEGLVLGQRLNIGFDGDGLEPAFWDRLCAGVRRHLDAAAGVELGV